MEEGKPVDAAYLDFKKAFDSVPHRRLLQKLHDLGVRGPVLKWIAAFLKNRSQRVSLNGAKSSWSPVTSGIPQGSVLGPTLFVLYVNDLPQCVTSFVKLFADDTKLYASVQSQPDRDQIQSDLHALGDWSKTWLLPFNSSKCKTLHLGHGNERQTYTLHDVELEQVSSERDLGVIVDDVLKFREQAAAVVAKGNRVLGLIRRSFENIDGTSLPLLYKTLVRPLLEYGNAVWGPFNKHDQNLVEKVQRRATKLVPNLRHLPYQERLKALKLPSLTYRRRRGDMIQMYKLFSGNLGLRREDFLAEPQTQSTRGHSKKVAKPQAQTRVRRNHLFVRAINDWNALPDAIVCATSVNSFKNELDNHWAAYQFDMPT